MMQLKTQLEDARNQLQVSSAQLSFKPLNSIAAFEALTYPMPRINTQEMKIYSYKKSFTYAQMK